MTRSAKAIGKSMADALKRLQDLHGGQMSLDLGSEEFETARQEIQEQLARYADHCAVRGGPGPGEQDAPGRDFFRMADSAPVMIWISGADKLYFWFNKPWLDFTGRTMEQELGNGWVEGVHPDDLDHCFQCYTSHFDRREPFSMEYRLRRRDGQYRWIVDSGVPRFDGEGKFVGYMGSCIDIHGIRNISARIVKVSRLYATISAANQALVRSTTFEDVLSSVCRACVEQGGFSMAWIGFADSQGERLEMAEMFGVGTSLMKDRVLSLDDCLAEGNCPTCLAYRDERVVVANDFDDIPGTASWHQVVASLGFRAQISLPLCRNGKVVGVFSAFGSERGVFDQAAVDLLTELSGNISFALDQRALQVRHRAAEAALSESELRFQQAFTHTPVGMVISDLSGRCRWVNPAYCRMIGYSAEELGHSGAFGFLCLDDTDSQLALVRKMLEGEVDSCRLESRHTRKDGCTILLWVNVSLIRDESGQPQYFMVQCEDITHRKRMEGELTESKEKLRALSVHLERRLEEERKHIAREVHDELGQLLSLLKMDISMARDRTRAVPELQERMAEMSALVEKTIEVVRNVTHNLRPAVFDLGIVSAISWLAEDFSRRWGIPCRLDVRSHGLDMDDVRATVLFRVVQESLTNVARHAGASNVDIILGNDGDRLSLMIRDNGVGFDYARVRSGGPGFGLLGMRERVLGLEGILDIETWPDRGTAVIIRIPFRPGG